MVWGSFLIAAAALKTPTKNGYNAQGVNLTTSYQHQTSNIWRCANPQIQTSAESTEGISEILVREAFPR